MHLSPYFPTGSAAKGQGHLTTGHRSGSWGTGHVQKVIPEPGLGLSFGTAPRMGFVLSRPVSFSVAATGYTWLTFN